MVNTFKKLLNDLDIGKLRVIAQDAKDVLIAKQFEELLNSEEYKHATPIQQAEFRIGFRLHQQLK